MAFALLITGAVFLIASIRGTQDNLTTLIKGDFTGPQNFLYWVIAILLIGFTGYIPKVKPLSVAFLVLVILVLILTKGNPNGIGGGFFQQFTNQIGATQTPAPSSTAATSVPISTLNTGSLSNLATLPTLTFPS